MARVTYVKKARQRYATVPVIDPETGQPKVTPVIDKRTGEPKRTKRGREITMRVTVSDKSKPLPPFTCDHCRKPIEVGTPYKHISPKSGPYGGRQLNRHQDCPTWNVWDYSYSMSAQLARISHEFGVALDGAESADDVQSALEDAANEVREIAEQKRESAENIRDGFGHDTYQSEELDQTADDLEGWADEIESVDVPELPEEVDCEECEATGEQDCDECSGMGKVPHDDEVDESVECDDCGGTGTVDCEECSGTGQVEPQAIGSVMDDWLDEVRDATAVVDESPV